MTFDSWNILIKHPSFEMLLFFFYPFILFFFNTQKNNGNVAAFLSERV